MVLEVVIVLPFERSYILLYQVRGPDDPRRPPSITYLRNKTATAALGLGSEYTKPTQHIVLTRHSTLFTVYWFAHDNTRTARLSSALSQEFMIWSQHDGYAGVSVPVTELGRQLIYTIVPKNGIRVCASQKLKTSLGPVISILGVRPLKKDVMPSFFIILPIILKPLSGFSKLRF